MNTKGGSFMKYLLLCIPVIAAAAMFQAKPDLIWTMVNVNYSQLQGDAHLIQTRGGKTILIDTGYRHIAEKALIPVLQKKHITTLDIVFISHPHKDHYGGLYDLMKHHMGIKKIYFNIPDKKVCDREIPWGCDYNDVLATRKALINYGADVKTARPGMIFPLGADTNINILYAFDGVHTPVGRTDINDMSLIMMLTHRDLRFLFTGDLNRKIGTYLAKNSDSIQADILKVPHHGTEGTAPNIFFQKVSPDYGLVPAPKHLWLSERSKRIRDWFKAKDVPVFVNGLDGDVTVIVRGNSYKINSAISGANN